VIPWLDWYAEEAMDGLGRARHLSNEVTTYCGIMDRSVGYMTGRLCAESRWRVSDESFCLHRDAEEWDDLLEAIQQ
jgi:hypothetical protein